MNMDYGRVAVFGRIASSSKMKDWNLVGRGSRASRCPLAWAAAGLSRLPSSSVWLRHHEGQALEKFSIVKTEPLSPFGILDGIVEAFGVRE